MPKSRRSAAADAVRACCVSSSTAIRAVAIRALDCFPPALLQPDANGVQREPLAADARAAGDGRERAFLKLVAGLLGVGYDTLAQREAQRRNRKLAIVAAASLAGMAIALALAATAWIARNDAQRRQAQAEDILGFMLGDLRQKLTTVGRLDLMRAVDSKATHYFATLDPRDLSDRALEEQARSLTGIGQVRLEETNHAAAMTAFREAHARSTALRARQPDNGQRLFDLAQAEYWIGYVAWKQGRLDDAETWLRKYRDSAITLAAMDRSNFDWQKEVAYGHHNLAVMDESRGLHAQAEQAMREELKLFRGWMRQRPDDTALQFEASTVVSWLGSSSAKQGKLQDAAAFFSEQVRGLERLHAAEPANVRWSEELTSALVQRAGVQAQRGRLDEARRDVEAAAAQASALARHDPDNRKWRVAQGITLGWQAQLDAATRPDAAEAHARAAQALFVGVKPAETKDVLALRWLARTQLFLARLALSRHDLAVTRAPTAERQRHAGCRWPLRPTTITCASCASMRWSSTAKPRNWPATMRPRTGPGGKRGNSCWRRPRTRCRSHGWSHWCACCSTSARTIRRYRIASGLPAPDSFHSCHGPPRRWSPRVEAAIDSRTRAPMRARNRAGGPFPHRRRHDHAARPHRQPASPRAAVQRQ